MSSEITAKANYCAKCGLQIEPFSADPGLWAIWTSIVGDNGETKPYHSKCVICNPDELTRLRTENQSLREQVERVTEENEALKTSLQLIETGKYGRNELHAELQAHKEALEKARVALEACQDYITGKSQWVGLVPLTKTLSTINQILK